MGSSVITTVIMYQSQQAMLLIIKKSVKNVVPMLINHILQNISSYYPFWQGDLCHVLMYNPRRASIAVILLVILVISKLIVFYRHKSKANQPKRPPNKIQKKRALLKSIKDFYHILPFVLYITLFEAVKRRARWRQQKEPVASGDLWLCGRKKLLHIQYMIVLS